MLNIKFSGNVVAYLINTISSFFNPCEFKFHLSSDAVKFVIVKFALLSIYIASLSLNVSIYIIEKYSSAYASENLYAVLIIVCPVQWTPPESAVPSKTDPPFDADNCTSSVAGTAIT